MRRETKRCTTRLILAFGAPFVVGLTLLLGGQPASAITITNSGSAPNTNVAVSQTTFDDSSDLVWRNVAGPEHQYLGQTFTPSTSFTVDKISFLVRQENAGDRSDAGHTITVEIFSAASESAILGTTLLSESGITPAYGKTSNQWLTFDVSNTVSLTAGLIYGINIDYAFLANGPMAGGHKIGGDAPAGLQRNSSSDPLSGGQAFRIFNGAPQGIAGDLAFVIQSGQPVPEPSTVTLAVLGLLGMVAVRRRPRAN